ncbi:MAG: gas vesicle protein GvpG [Lachnospiraceae bacterium]|nr:gas vesicle protein GvpG [Lachnospiraceae bacterium]MCD7882769.1 gas vesicle protein GvpG [Lachnospiraceae bacterium]
MDNKQFEAEKNYQASMLCFRQMLDRGQITQKDYERIDTILLKKYRPLLGSLCSDIRLT